MKHEQLRPNWHIKTYIIVIVSALILATAFQNVKAITSGDYNYTVTDNKVTITGYVGSGGAVVIPSTLDSYPVVAIGEDAFYQRESLTSVTIPDSVISIGNYSFSGCRSLLSITIGNSVTTLGNYAFSGCIYLTSVTLPDGVTSIGNYTFNECGSLASITIPDSVTDIGNYAFQRCYALTSITIPDSVTSIGIGAFYFCRSLTTINVDAANPTYSSIEGVLFNKDGTELVEYPMGKSTTYEIPAGVTTVRNYAFANCGTLTSVIIPNSVTTISNYAFLSCYALSSITIPDSVTSLGDHAFEKCQALSSATLSNGLSSISNYVFYYCRGLTSITIPNSVTSIGDGVFSECSSLTSVTIPNSVTSIGNYVFSMCERLASITIPTGITRIGIRTFGNCRSLTSVTIPYGVTIIDVAAFDSCLYLTSVTIPNSVTSIGDRAFRTCWSLPTITIPASVTSIGKDAFFYCAALTAINVDTANPNYKSIDGVLFNKDATTLIVCPKGKSGTYEIPASVTTIGDNAFAECSSLTTVIIPDGVTSIGSYGFAWCDSLSNIIIPKSVTNIGSCAFQMYRSSDITFLGITPPTVSSDWYLYGNSATRGHAYYGSSFPTPGNSFNGLIMGDYIPEDYYYTISNGQATITGYHGTDVDLTIPATLGGCPVVAIGDNAFMSLTSLASITIPNSVSSIGNNAFSGCTLLSSITFFGLTPPTTGTNWILNTYELYGHAYYGSSFPTPGNSFNGLTMGYNIPEGYQYTINSGQVTITKYIGNSKDVTIPATLGGCPVVAIGNKAFSGRGPTSVIIPDCVSSIGSSAFEGCGLLTSITIPDSVTSIGNKAFYGCYSLSSITLPTSITSISAYTFYGCQALSSITIPDSITSIGDSAFFGCSSLTSVVIPESVTSIGNDAFVFCRALQSVTISNGVTAIGDLAFEGCSSLTSVTIPASVTSMGYVPFMTCSSLAEINVDSANPNFKSINGILFDKSGTTLLQYPVGKTATSFTIPTGVTTIGVCAFAECTVLASITIPTSVTSIDDAAFYRCSFTSITLPNSITSIGDAAFEECSALTSIIIPNGVTNVGNYVFAWCESLTSVTIPESVTTIGDYAFDGTSLTSIIIPNGVTSIGDHAFEGCSSLTNMTFLGLTPPTVNLIYGSWIDNTNPALLGHAYYGSSFPAPDSSFNGLKMGDYLPDTIAPKITSVAPSSPVTLSTQGTTASQTFSASYTDNVVIASATITLDGTDVSSAWGVSTSAFSYTATLPIGSHTIVLTVKDIADSLGIQRTSTQTWIVNVLDVGVPVISNISPSSSLTLYTQGRTATQTFTASYSDNLVATSAIVTLDGNNVNSLWGVTTSGFSYAASLTVGSHTILLRVSDAAGNIAEQTWSVTVIKDTTKPTISGIADQKITYGTDIAVVITDSQSGVNWNSLKVTIDNLDITASVVKTGNGFTLSSTWLTKGAHSVTITISDNIGNTNKLACNIIVK